MYISWFIPMEIPFLWTPPYFFVSCEIFQAPPTFLTSPRHAFRWCCAWRSPSLPTRCCHRDGSPRASSQADRLRGGHWEKRASSYGAWFQHVPARHGGYPKFAAWLTLDNPSFKYIYILKWSPQSLTSSRKSVDLQQKGRLCWKTVMNT